MGYVTHTRSVSAIVAALVMSTTTAAAQGSSPVGRIKVLSGSAFIVRASGVVPAQLGQPLFEADGIRTADGRVGFTLNDDTRLSLGANSEIRLERFEYAPGEGRLAFLLRIVSGVTTYISGRIARLSPDSVRIETPAAVIGVRGTHLAIDVGTS
jgi:hypothetical protein